MVKGSPDSQHELITTGIGRCLKAAYPAAKLTFGQIVPDLRLKPDLFVDHPNGQRWAYEVINKSRAVGEIEAKHQRYRQAGVQAYWILWQTLGPEEPLDETVVATQSVWLNDEIVDAPRHYQLNKLQRRLAHLGNGDLYVFSIHKPLLDLVKHWGMKLIMVGLDVYHFALEQSGADWVKADWEFVPLPYLIFDEHGRPRCKPGMAEVPPHLQSLVGPLSGGPVFVGEALASFDALLQTPSALLTPTTQALTQLNEQYAHDNTPVTEELAQALEHFQKITAEMSRERMADEAGALEFFDALDELTAALPLSVQTALRNIFPMTGGMLRQILELGRWFEEDKHLHKLLAEM